MRLKQFITEDKDNIVDIIKNNCKQSLRLYKNTKKLLYRGITYNFNVNWSTKKVRKNRKPRDMDIVSQKMLDKEFKKKFGWEPRSQGLFCVGDNKIAKKYGNVGVVFIKGGFDYLWSPTIPDLYYYESGYNDSIIGGIKELFSAMFLKDKTIKDDIEKIVSEYTNKNIKMYLTKYPKNEIMIKCDEYIVIEENFFFSEIKDKL